MKKILFVMLFASLIITGCYYDNAEELSAANGPEPCDSTGTILFSSQIQPIFTSRCGSGDAACHNSDNSLSNGGNGSLADYNGTIETISDRGPIDFMQRINHDPALASSKWMPKGVTEKIEVCSIVKIQKWIDQGQQNN